MRLFLCFALPPLAVLLYGRPLAAVLCALLTLAGWAPGVVYALAIAGGHKWNVSLSRLETQVRSSQRSQRAMHR